MMNRRPYLTINEVVPFKEGSTTERGEKIYVMFSLEVRPPGMDPIRRVLVADPGMGFTEEWIEDTLYGAIKALENDFPDYEWDIERTSVNNVVIKAVAFFGKLQ